MAGRVRHLWWVVGLLLVLGGAVTALTASARPTDLGWFAYTPLDEGSGWAMEWGEGSAVIVARTQLVGWAVTGLGLVVLASWVGFRLGRRRAPEPV